MPEPPSGIHVDLVPGIAGTLIHQRFDLQIRGRVVSPRGIKTLELLSEDVVVTAIRYGRPPSEDGPVQQAFRISLSCRPEWTDAPCRFVIRPRAHDGRVAEQAFSLARDPANPKRVVVVSGPTEPLQAYPDIRPPIILHVERALVNTERNLLIRGWTVASERVTNVQVFIGENDRVLPAVFGTPRADVARAYAAYPNALESGFSLSARLDATEAEGLTTVRLQSVSTEGDSHSALVTLEHLFNGDAPEGRAQGTHRTQQSNPDHAAPSANGDGASASESEIDPMPRSRSVPEQYIPTDQHRKIDFCCDEATLMIDGLLRVLGWAVCSVSISRIEIFLDDANRGEAELALPRPDVGRAYAAVPKADCSGFRFEQVIPNLSNGEHRLRIVVRNGMDDAREEIRQLGAIAEPKRIATDAQAVSLAPAKQPVGTPEFRFQLDTPHVTAGAASEPVIGRFLIEGWVLARSGVSSIAVLLDDQPLGEATYGLARPDVHAVFPEWHNSLRSGYAYDCPPRVPRNGTRHVKLVATAKNGQTLEHAFSIDVNRPGNEARSAGIRRRIASVEKAVIHDLIRDLAIHPRFRLFIRQTGPLVPAHLQATIESLRTQIYPDWHLSIRAESRDDVEAVDRIVSTCPDGVQGRITTAVAALSELDMTAASDGSLPLWFGVLSSGDELGCDALAEFALAAALYPGSEFLYADEVRDSPVSLEREPFYKPDFSPDLLLSTNYIGRPWFAAADLLQRTGVTLSSSYASSGYDIVLRLTEAASGVHHLPKPLASRGIDIVADEAADRAALADAAARRNFAAEVLDGRVSGTYRLKRTPPANGKVSIIVPTCAAHGRIETCIGTIRDKTAYANYEIVCLDNISEDRQDWKAWLRENADRVLDAPGAFNWSRFNNRAADATVGEFLLFLNDDVEILQQDWLDVLLEHAQRPEVGVVGPLLLYPNHKVQHAGMFLGESAGRHAFRHLSENDPGYFGLALTQRNVIAVTGACMMIRRSLFEALGRFEEAHPVINNDLDFCLRAHRAGKLTVFTPHAKLIHHELASRDRMADRFDTSLFGSQWKTLFAAGDPYFNPRLSRFSDDYRPDDEPAQTVFAAHPLFRVEEIGHILVVKLDHIGDFITALPAIRRLRTLFPQASISVLGKPTSRDFAEMEPAIDSFIEFKSFDARPQLGENTLSDADYAVLAEQLAPYGFDLAVDLRKQLSTRELLRHTGARFLAGYDYRGQCPYLDIALEWDGNKTLRRKRSHVVDDLLALVEVIGTACETDRALLHHVPKRRDPATMPDPMRALFDRPVVAIHAGAGSVIKQWPEAYFAKLIDLLIERSAVNVLLVGGPEEKPLAERLIAGVVQQGRVASVVGQTPLADLPNILAGCTLCIGNDSGPTHIAAAVGISTIGIHSGVADAAERAPVGRRAVALQRNMTCSPCYLTDAADCPRGLACLRQLDPTIVHQTAERLLAHPVAPIGVRAVEEHPAPISPAVGSRRRDPFDAPAVGPGVMEVYEPAGLGVDALSPGWLNDVEWQTQTPGRENAA